ncbi:MAG: phosphate ABC transporter permease subunit PstC [Verrucomicrobia bacterium]|nr:phosphate ABC transporter permease subunit PstC [Verrucomicrobiota bacterium]
MAESTPAPDFPVTKRRLRFFGLTSDELVQLFFRGNAMVSVLVLALITLFLFKEGLAFFGQNQRNLEVYRRAGLDYVDQLRQQEQDHTALNRYLLEVRMKAVADLAGPQGLSVEAVNQRLEAFDQYSIRFDDAIAPLRGLVSELSETASAIKTKFYINEDKRTEQRQLRAAGRADEAARVAVEEVDFAREIEPILASREVYLEINRGLSRELQEIAVLARAVPGVPAERMERFAGWVVQYVAGFPAIEQRLATWDHREPVSLLRSFSAFIFGRQWLTASFWQDWYGVLPLFVGSLMVSLIALSLAVPLGVGAAIYVNQIASPAEQRIIKPCIEFIAAFPSVVLGFFGIAVLGEFLRSVSGAAWLDWVPGFPLAERLNALTAGCLLGLIAVPTIFTLAEDALQNVPRSFKEASFALGATRLQTIVRVIIPTALSGIISAVLLGLGRVIGETMVVLLCAGNRIEIPDFTAGLAAFFQPVHSMTGIIAQEMGEVVRGEIHYRALFVVGIVLFFLSLTINFTAQKVLRRYRQHPI